MNTADPSALSRSSVVGGDGGWRGGGAAIGALASTTAGALASGAAVERAVALGGDDAGRARVEVAQPPSAARKSARKVREARRACMTASVPQLPSTVHMTGERVYMKCKRDGRCAPRRAVLAPERASSCSPRAPSSSRARAPVVAEAAADGRVALTYEGVAQFSVDRVARAAEVNKTSVYRRWPTREALVAAALERVLDQLTLALADTGTLRGDLLSLCDGVAKLLALPELRDAPRVRAFMDHMAEHVPGLLGG